MIEINKIYCEDCMDTMSRMPDDFVNLVVTSPPYNLGTTRVSDSNFLYNQISDNLDLKEYFNLTKKWIDELIRVTKYHVFYNIQELTNNKGIIKFILNNYNVKETFIWAKLNSQSSICDTMCSSGYEYIFCISKDNPDSRKFNYCNFSNKNGDYMRNIIIKPTNTDKKETKFHSYIFPDWLPKFFINYFSIEGDLVYDPFMGSGTTAKASHLLKRNWIGSEISQEYVDLANKRLQPYLSQKTLF